MSDRTSTSDGRTSAKDPRTDRADLGDARTDHITRRGISLLGRGIKRQRFLFWVSVFGSVLFGFMDTRLWGTVLIVVATVLTIWSMIYYLKRAVPEIRAKAR